MRCSPFVLEINYVMIAGENNGGSTDILFFFSTTFARFPSARFPSARFARSSIHTCYVSMFLVIETTKVETKHNNERHSLYVVVIIFLFLTGL